MHGVGVEWDAVRVIWRARFPLAGGLLHSSLTTSTTATLPEGLSLNASTGAISGTVYGQEPTSRLFTVTDSLGSYGTLSSIVFNIAGRNMNSGTPAYCGSSSTREWTRCLSIHLRAVSIPSSNLGTHIIEIDGGSQPDAGGIPFLIVPSNQATNIVTPIFPGWSIINTFPPYSVLSPSSRQQQLHFIRIRT